MKFRTRRAAQLVFAFVWLLGAGTAVAQSARDILDATGVSGGLVVHLGCGDGRLTAGLRADEGYLVHGLDFDGQSVHTAREYISSLGIYGNVSVERFDGQRLPYVDNLVNLVVAEDLGGVSTEEVMRVLCPGGVAYVKQGSAWTKTVKRRPEDVDQWTHFLHDPSGNAVAKDRKVGPPRRIQWTAGPKRSRDHDSLASMSAMTSSGGRIFYIYDEGPTSLIHRPSQWRLIARDALNGVRLWQREIDSWVTHLYFFRSGPVQLPRRLVSIGDRVYVTLGLEAPVTALDAATGKTLLTFQGSERTEEIICCDDVLLAVVGDPALMNREAEQVFGYWELSVDRKPEVEKAVVAYRASTGETLWRKSAEELAHLVPLSL
ncbi:MAG: class I SAM-dependent methyltransferase, partial [Planctomycetota bacterium]